MVSPEGSAVDLLLGQQEEVKEVTGGVDDGGEGDCIGDVPGDKGGDP